MYLQVHPKNPQGRYIQTAVGILRNGGTIIYPTDTVYGIGCSVFNSSAIERIYLLKHQRKSKTFSFICSDLSHISEYARVSNSAYRLMKQLIPGPYTFILPSSGLRQLPKSLISDRKTVGIRVPNNITCQMLVKELGHPILSASVLDRLEKIISEPEKIRGEFEKRVDLILGELNSIRQFSTVIDLTEDKPVILREGAGDTSMFITE